jgi:hypothetical protein
MRLLGETVRLMNVPPDKTRVPSPRRHVQVLLLVAVLAAAAFPISAAAARRHDGGAASAAPTRVLAFGTLGDRAAARLLATRPNEWGGRIRASTGEQVTVFISDRYPVDPALAQRWADFLAALVHGPEIGELTAYVAPLAEVQSICGREALACYSPSQETLVTPGEAAFGASAESIIAHEYGHHVATNRRNDPFPAVDWGTKRWATHERVCPQAREGTVVPGAEDAENYALDPGEGFAEAYRVLNERRLGLPSLPWEIVSTIFLPDETALQLLEQDVVAPWAGNTTTRLAGALTRARRLRTTTIATPLDGTLRVTMTAPRAARLRLELLTTTGSRVGSRTASSGTATLTTTVCGSRSYRVRVTTPSAAARYRLTVSKP